jgi:hypothetical protein
LLARNSIPRLPVTNLGARAEFGYVHRMRAASAARTGAFVRAVACAALIGLLHPLDAHGSAAPTDSVRRLAFLESLVGDYPRDIRLWEHPGLHWRLSSLLGKRLPFFYSNMWNTGTVSRNGHWIYVTGTRRPLAGRDAAVFVADLERDTIWVWVMISGQLFHYRERAAQPELPTEVSLFLHGWRTFGVTDATFSYY